MGAFSADADNDTVQVDASLPEPALLVPLYGIAPRSRILYLPEALNPVDTTLLQALLTIPVLDKRAWTPTSKLHQAYQALCEKYGLQSLSAPHFTRALTARFGLEAVRHKVQGVVTRGIQGIRLKWMNIEQ